jgi:hypothetical protein
LIIRNTKHFAQAHNTPCASRELHQLLGDNGITETSREALKGRVRNTNITKESKNILKELKQIRETLPDIIPLTDITNGFLKWREKTETSPSGKHLGIYRTIIKWYTGKYKQNKTHQSTRKMEKEKQTNNEKAKLAVNIQHNIMNMAIKHCYTYQRWKKIHNFFIEKFREDLC